MKESLQCFYTSAGPIPVAWASRYSNVPGAVFTNIPILVLTLVIHHFNHMPDFISVTVSTILALKSYVEVVLFQIN